jgi:hypothetical protein
MPVDHGPGHAADDGQADGASDLLAGVEHAAACSNGDLSGLLAGQPDVTVDHFGVHVGVQGSIRVLRRYDATDPVRRGPVCRLMWSATIISGL